MQKLRSQLATCAAVAVLAPILSVAGDRSDIVMRLGAKAFRGQVKIHYLPTFPSYSLSRGSTGVMVANVTVNKEGTVSGVTILEAPDELIASAVRDEFKKWRFHPVTLPGGSPVRFQGKVFLYFRVVGGRGFVLDPLADTATGGPPY